MEKFSLFLSVVKSLIGWEKGMTGFAGTGIG